MKQLTCEMCGGTELIKQDGVFVCQNCGMKYSVEEAKKMMIEGTVDVQGTVKVDSSDRLKKLYQAARNARETSDSQSAIKYYEQLVAEDPDSWEALFYLVVLKSEHITNAEISSSANSISACLPKVFELIKATVTYESEQKQAVEEVMLQCQETARGLADASYNFYKSVTRGNGTMAVLGGVSGMITSSVSTAESRSEDSDRCIDIANIMIRCGNLIERMFNMADEDWQGFAVSAWEAGLEHELHYNKLHHTHMMSFESRKMIVSKINQYDPEFTIEYFEQVSKVQTLTKSATSSKWGTFFNICCWIFAFIPGSGLMINGCILCFVSKGNMTNVKKKNIKVTFGISIAVTILYLLFIAALC